MIVTPRWQRFWGRLRYLRHRKGYGVHSPFAYDFLMNVVYERTPYYAYQAFYDEYGHDRLLYTPADLRIAKLLFRISNYRQPDVVMSIGYYSLSTEALAACKPNMRVYTEEVRETLDPDTVIDILYIDSEWWGDEAQRRQFDIFKAHLNEHSICIVENIHTLPADTAHWEHIKNDPMTVVTFDLYDLGIAFFDKRLSKQHYKVHF
jgi:hypothetical protein